MKKKFKLGVLGAGFMATAIIKGAIKSKIVKNSSILVTDISNDALDKISKLKVKTTTDLLYLVENCEYVLFAVKPQNAVEILEKIKDLDIKNIITIMAGFKISKIKKYLPTSKVARLMPNTPCSINCGSIAIDLKDYSGKDKDFVYNLFSSLGVVVLVDESDLNAVTGISGSSPAYFYYFVKAVIDAGVKNGLDEETAKKLAVNTMLGSAKMIKLNDNVALDDLINAVCSKGGTTIEAIKSFEDDKLSDNIIKGVDACIKRSKELENL